MSDSPEKRIFDFLTESQTAAANGSLIKDFSIEPTVYSFSDQCIRVGNCKSEFTPGQGGIVEEIEADTHLQLLVKVDDKEKPETYVTAREIVRAIALDVAQIIYDDLSLGGRDCSTILKRGFRGWSTVQTKYCATVILPMQIEQI